MRVAILTSPRSGSTSLFYLLDCHLKKINEKYVNISEPFNSYWRTKRGLKLYDIDDFKDSKFVLIKTFVGKRSIPKFFGSDYESYWKWFFNYFDKIILLDRKNKDLQAESLAYHLINQKPNWHEKQVYDLNIIPEEKIKSTKEMLIEESNILHNISGYPLFYFEDIFVDKNREEMIRMLNYLEIEMDEGIYKEYVVSDLHKVRIDDKDINFKKII